MNDGFAGYIRRGIHAALIALAFLLLLPETAFADISIAVYPTFLEFTGDAGASTSQGITVTNKGTGNTSVSITIGDLETAHPEDSAATWLSTDKQHFVLEPGESQEFTVTIRIPKNADPGGHFAAVYIQASTGAGEWSDGAGVGASVLSSFMITVRSPEPDGLRLQGTLVEIVPLSKGANRLGFRAEIENTGNVHFVPRGDLALKDREGNIIGTLPLPEGISVLPGTTRSYYFTGTLAASPGEYTVIAKVDYSWEKWQAVLARAGTGEWSTKEIIKERTLNSVPRLRIESISPVVETDHTIRIDVEMANYGDVEVAPQGYLDFLTSSGQEVFAGKLGTSADWIEPHSSTVASVGYGGVILKGDYTVRTVLDYHGEEEARQNVVVTVDEDLIPTPASRVVEERDAQAASADGVSVWITAIAVVAGVMSTVILTLAIQRYRRLKEGRK